MLLLPLELSVVLAFIRIPLVPLARGVFFWVLLLRVRRT
jgi:hypothetical protein